MNDEFKHMIIHVVLGFVDLPSPLGPLRSMNCEILYRDV